MTKKASFTEVHITDVRAHELSASFSYVFYHACFVDDNVDHVADKQLAVLLENIWRQMKY